MVTLYQIPVWRTRGRLRKSHKQKIFLTKEAAKFYQKSDEKTKNRLDKCFEKLKINPNDGTNIKRLHGELSGLYRYRIGQLRVIYRIEEQRKVIVIAIGSRGNVYKKN